MDRRKRILVNEQEVATDAALRRVVEQYGARVYSKVRIADALDISNSGITNAEYTYALRGHFDFVVADSDHIPLFAVEFDGSQHDRDVDVIHRDHLKNCIATKLGLPLLRIDRGYLRVVRDFVLIAWLAELWFHYAAFAEAQDRGDLSWDEPWDHASIVAMPPDSRAFPFWLDLPARSYVQSLFQKQRIKSFIPTTLVAQDSGGHYTGAAIVEISPGRYVMGTGRCRSFNFPPVHPAETRGKPSGS